MKTFETFLFCFMFVFIMAELRPYPALHKKIWKFLIICVLIDTIVSLPYLIVNSEWAKCFWRGIAFILILFFKWKVFIKDKEEKKELPDKKTLELIARRVLFKKTGLKL